MLESGGSAEWEAGDALGGSVLWADGQEVDRKRMSGLTGISGHGVRATIDGRSVAAGNDRLMDSLGLAACRCSTPGTIVHLAIDGDYSGHIVMGDVEKPEAKAAIEDLHRSGVRRTVMLTGDTRAVAEQVGRKLGIDEVYSQLLPADKVMRMEEIMDSARPGEKTAFVGDGIKDAPVLSTAEPGIATGATGAVAAIQTAHSAAPAA